MLTGWRQPRLRDNSKPLKEKLKKSVLTSLSLAVRKELPRIQGTEQNVLEKALKNGVFETFDVGVKSFENQ